MCAVIAQAGASLTVASTQRRHSGRRGVQAHRIGSRSGALARATCPGGRPATSLPSLAARTFSNATAQGAGARHFRLRAAPVSDIRNAHPVEVEAADGTGAAALTAAERLAQLERRRRQEQPAGPTTEPAVEVLGAWVSRLARTVGIVGLAVALAMGSAVPAQAARSGGRMGGSSFSSSRSSSSFSSSRSSGGSSSRSSGGSSSRSSGSVGSLLSGSLLSSSRSSGSAGSSGSGRSMGGSLFGRSKVSKSAPKTSTGGGGGGGGSAPTYIYGNTTVAPSPTPSYSYSYPSTSTNIWLWNSHKDPAPAPAATSSATVTAAPSADEEVAEAQTEKALLNVVLMLALWIAYVWFMASIMP